ncbi:hypothetical protein ABLE92_13735 [Gordonia sp. VNQ95]|uniref:hypothetical protein n=1 Tax=Gordonia sp. VNQ95 TaxID=3156619 RepID=UPI0032B47DAA
MLATFGAALFQGLASTGGRGFVTYIAVWPEPDDGFGSETLRYLTVAVIGILIGALAATVSYVTGARAAPAGSRVGLTVTAGLVGITLGLAPVLAMLTVTDYYPDLSPLLIYGICGVLAYVLAVAAVGLALRAVGDERVRSTMYATAAVLPIGAVAATAGGVLSAWTLGFSTTTSTWIVVVILVIGVLGATLAVARGVALRRAGRGAGHDSHPV